MGIIYKITLNWGVKINTHVYIYNDKNHWRIKMNSWQQNSNKIVRERERDRQTDRQRERERETDRQIDREWQRDRQRRTISFLSLLATASRLYAIAWGFLLRHKRIFITAIFIRALLLNQTQCGTITANWMWSRGIFYSFSISLT